MDVEQRLYALADEMIPPAPNIATTVAAQLATDFGPGRPTRHRAFRRAAVLLAALALPAAAVAAVPSARDALLTWFGLDHVWVLRVARLPPAPAPVRVSALGARVDSPQAAGARARMGVAVPSALGTPDDTFVSEGRRVSLGYRRVSGLRSDSHTGYAVVVTEIRAEGARELVTKLLTQGTNARKVSVRGRPAVFISGAQHEVLYRLPGGGTMQRLRPRLAGNALVFESRGAVYRIEGRLNLRQALSIATSMR